MVTRPRVAVIGGGFSGAVFAIHLSRTAERPLDIFIVEPRAELGRGLAYDSANPDHRMNAPLGLHFIYPDDPDYQQRWYIEQDRLARDPDAEVADGALFPRRADYGAFIAAELARHQASNTSGSTIRHHREAVCRLDRNDAGVTLSLGNGELLPAEMAVLTTSNEKPAPPTLFASLETHSAFINDPWDEARLRSISASGSVLVMGMAQTAADVIATLLGRGHKGPIEAVSRRGLRPRRRPLGGKLPQPITDRIMRPVSYFAEAYGRHDTVLSVLRTLRAATRRDENWTPSFDDLRDSLRDVWPDLPIAEKRRFQRHLRTWYDVHRFRLPPQIEARLDWAEANGQLTFEAARIIGAAADGDRLRITRRPRGASRTRESGHDAVINCTGLDHDPAHAANPLIRNLLADGLARPHPTRLGFDVDDQCRALNASGAADPLLRIVGPLTLGRFGDPLGAPFIAAHIARIMPDIVGTLYRP